jgi:GntR family transcriptional regulator
MAYRYLEIAADLRRRIESGEFPPGSRLPGKSILSRYYDAGGPLIQEAITALELDGLVVIRERSGTYVTEPERHPRQRLDIGRQVRRNELGYVFARPAGHWHPIGAPTRAWVPCPDDMAELLDVEPGSDVLARRRVVGPGMPMQITTTFIRADLARGTVLEDGDTGPGGWMDRVEQDMGLGPLGWPDEVYARLPTAEEAETLVMSPKLPVLVEARAHEVSLRGVIAVDEIVRDARRFSVRFRIGRSTSARWPTPKATARNRPNAPDGMDAETHGKEQAP